MRSNMPFPGLGMVTARQERLLFLTSNATRAPSDALKRRRLYLHLDCPDPERERQIIKLLGPRYRARARPAGGPDRARTALAGLAEAAHHLANRGLGRSLIDLANVAGQP
jgi:MoxR-like ATPase